MKTLIVGACFFAIPLLTSLGAGDAKAQGIHVAGRGIHVDFGYPHSAYGVYPSYGSLPVYHSYKTHLDFDPGGYVWHRNHVDFVPPHYDVHRGHHRHHH